MNGNLEVLPLGNFSVIVNKDNGRFIKIENELVNDEEYLEQYFIENSFYKDIPINKADKSDIKIVDLTLHSTFNCNLNCKYCFIKEKTASKDLTFEMAKTFIDMMMSYFNEAVHFNIDLTGSGEPLLNMKLLDEVVSYAKILRNNTNKTILISFATNGTLLTKEIIDYLVKEQIYFGVSLDGDKATNDEYRISKNYKSVYKKVISNIKKLKNKEFMGAATTITNRNLDLIKTIKALRKYFHVISMKPIREVDGHFGAFDENSIKQLMNSYTNLFEFILNETLLANYKYITAILKSDDYFGKFIKRVISNSLIASRCAAGVSKFSLTSDGFIYACGAGVNYDDFIIGDIHNGIDNLKIEILYDIQFKKTYCQNCWAKFLCGGECMVRSKLLHNVLGKPDELMCMLNKHLIKLAFLFKYILYEQNESVFNEIYNFCLADNNR